VAEAALHVLCKCAATYTPCRELIVNKGGLKSVAELLAAPSPDTKVCQQLMQDGRPPCLDSCCHAWTAVSCTACVVHPHVLEGAAVGS
jgi:hypothetical protein